MKIEDIIAITIKITGLILLSIGVARMPEYVNVFLSDEMGHSTVKSLLLLSPFLIIMAIAFLFILLPYKVSNELVTELEPILKHNKTFNELQIICVRILGLILLFWSMSDIIFHLFNYMVLRENRGELSLSSYNYPFIVATIAEILFAVFLFKKTKTICAYLNSYEK